MSQFEKLLWRIRTLDKDMRFNELKKVLEHYGYVMEGPAGGSSHMTFRKEGKEIITIPIHNPIKDVYVRKVRDIVESEESKNENS